MISQPNLMRSAFRLHQEIHGDFRITMVLRNKVVVAERQGDIERIIISPKGQTNSAVDGQVPARAASQKADEVPSSQSHVSPCENATNGTGGNTRDNGTARPFYRLLCVTDTLKASDEYFWGNKWHSCGNFNDPLDHVVALYNVRQGVPFRRLVITTEGNA